MKMGGRRAIISVFLSVLMILYCFISYSSFGWRTEPKNSLFDLNIKVKQDDPQLLNFIREHHIFNPPPPPVHKQLTKRVNSVFPLPLNDPAHQHLLRLLQNKKSGFFVESGANDGEFLSNSLGLEVLKGWTGLLIEGSPTYFSKLKSKNRNAWLADTCLSESHPEQLEFLKSKVDKWWAVGNGRIIPGEKYKEPLKANGEKYAYHRYNYVSEGFVDCVPLYSVLSAINVTHVDFFSLDVEGNEYHVLKGIPYDRLNIDVIFVEYKFAPEGKQAFIDLMTSNGYVYVHEGPTDLIFSKMR